MTDAKTLSRDEASRAAFLAATEPGELRVLAVLDVPGPTLGDVGGTVHAAEAPAAFTPSPPRPAPPPQDWPHASIVRRSIAGDDEDITRRRPSMAGFLAALAASFDWGVPVRSSGDPSRYGGGGIGASGSGRAPAASTAREEYALAVRELARVCETLPSRTVASGHTFDGPAQIAMWSVCHGAGALTMHVIKGGNARVTRKGYVPPKTAVQRVPERHQVSATQYAGEDPDYTGPTLRDRGIVARPHEIGIICREVTRRVESAFVARGWVRARRKSLVVAIDSEVDVAKNEERIEGWKSIAPVVGRSEDTCAKLSRRAEHPLPAGPLMGRIVAYRSELLAWVDAEIERERLARRAS